MYVLLFHGHDLLVVVATGVSGQTDQQPIGKRIVPINDPKKRLTVRAAGQLDTERQALLATCNVERGEVADVLLFQRYPLGRLVRRQIDDAFGNSPRETIVGKAKVDALRSRRRHPQEVARRDVAQRCFQDRVQAGTRLLAMGVLQVSCHVDEVDVAIGGGLGLRHGDQRDLSRPGAQPFGIRHLRRQTFRPPRRVVLVDRLLAAEPILRCVPLAHQDGHRHLIALPDLDAETLFTIRRCLVTRPQPVVTIFRNLDCRRRASVLDVRLRRKQTFARDVLETDDIDHIIALAHHHHRPTVADRFEMLGLDEDAGGVIRRAPNGYRDEQSKDQTAKD